MIIFFAKFFCNKLFSSHFICFSQRQLAEIAEVIHTAYRVHQGVINLQTVHTQDSKDSADMEFGNKMATLIGDFLLANVATGLAELENTYVGFTFLTIFI